MNRVLSWPHTPIFPGLLEGLQGQRSKTVVTERGTIRFDQPLGAVEMRFPSPLQQLPPGCEVVVWWKGGGFVCAPAVELDHEEDASRRIAERLRQARAGLAAARRERQARPAVQVDIVLPPEPAPASPLLR